ncbi:uncharacterized protein LOC132605231 isoform X2 [Lycium barbarum]|uniref:uncharacterized protein LOC132605231 isoform X2 n=1 Tax=Lycium barbarum TaxID=112863 RepID=UPI00293F1A04|nr:uncharacterized protein LOC132605231 isoform X2 [Lycium barbarum]
MNETKGEKRKKKKTEIWHWSKQGTCVWSYIRGPFPACPHFKTNKQIPLFFPFNQTNKLVSPTPTYLFDDFFNYYFNHPIKMESDLSPLPHMDSSPDDFASISNFLSPMRGLDGRVDPLKCGSSSRRGCSYKENIAEMPKLSVEPLHMKRKKRGGGFNMRKSLAWDRAFSTEEGVLDPVELSLLSGTLVNTCGEALFTINEEERNPTSNDSLCDASSAYLNSNKKSTFKEIRAATLKEDKRKVSSKVLASPNGRTISKSIGCSRPLSSASLKRPADMNHGKSATKDSKLPKCQVSKLRSCLLPTSSKSTIPRASHLKNQVTDSAVSIQKNMGLRSYSRKVRNSQEKAKAVAEPLKDKSSSCNLRGNNASTESSLVNKASNTGLEMNPDATLTSSRAHSSERHDVCTPYALRLPHSTRTAVSSTQYLPAQAMRPSGLRMPSPSLGFFRQTKASDTSRLLKGESSMCPLQRSGDLRPPVALAKQEGKVNLANLNCRILGLEKESSTESCKVIKPGLEGNSVEKVNIPSVGKKLDPVSDKLRDPAGNFDEKVPDHIKHKEKKLQDAGLLMNGKQHPPQTGKHEHINKDGDLMNSIPGFIENKGSAGSDFKDAQFPQASYNTQSLVLRGLQGAYCNQNEAEESGICSVIDGSKSQYRNMINFSEEVREEGYVGCCNNLPGGEFETVKSFAVEDDGIFDNDKHIMKIKSNVSKAQREPRNNGGGNCVPLNFSGSDFSEEKMEKSEVASQYEDSHNLKEAFTSKQITDRVQTGGLVADVLSETLSDENCETNPGVLSIYSEHKSSGGNLLHSSDRSLSKHICIDQSQDEQIVETSLSALAYRPDDSGFDRFDFTSAQTELDSNRITVVQEDHTDIMCSSHVKITLAKNCNHSTDEEILSKLTTSLDFGSLTSATTDKMVSGVPGSIDECRKPIKESVLEVVDEAEIRDSSNYQNEVNLTGSMEFGLSSRGTQDAIGYGTLGPMGEGNKLIKDMFLLKEMDEFENRDSSNNPSDGSQMIKVKLGMPSTESLKVEESQMCSHADLIRSSSMEMRCHKAVLESPHTPPLGDTRQENEIGKTTNALTNILQMEDVHVDTHGNDAQLPGKSPSTVVEECESSNVFENFGDALPVRKSVNESGLESPCFLNQESPLIHGSGSVADELDVIHCVEDQLSYPSSIESLSVELDSSQGTSTNQTASVTTDCIELVEGDQTSSRIQRKVADILNQNIVVKESETGKPSGYESSHNEFCHGLENLEPCTNENTISPVKNTESCLKKGNLLILPPHDAVPFSDEWLAAMEAAGEDILTMKSGAVQNSPQEKSLPEPSPWSPVKKKNNQLGPFDCTKFHHNGPPES